jgi:DNA invertase Pin-like site-specific DNA recombinase
VHERSFLSGYMIQERVRAGLQRAKKQGKVLGRPRVHATVESCICKKRREGKGIIKIAKELGVGTSTVQRVVRAMGDGNG